MKVIRKTNKIILGLLLIAVIVVTVILLIGDTFTIASDQSKDGEFVFKWGSGLDSLNEDQEFGTFTISAPKGPYLMSNNSDSRITYDKERYYGNLQLDDLRMYLDNWDPGIRYKTDLIKDDFIPSQTKYKIRYHGSTNDSNNSKTYYIIGDEEIYNYDKLWSDFQEYVRVEYARDKESGLDFDIYTLPKMAVYGVSSGVGGSGTAVQDGAKDRTDKINTYLTGFLASKGAKEYKSNTGIYLSEIEKEGANVTVIRAGMSQIELDYYDESDADAWIQQYMPFLMLSVSNYPVTFKTSLNQPLVKAFIADIESTNQSSRVNNVYKDEFVQINFSGDEAINSKQLEYCLFSSDYTINEVVAMNRFRKVEDGGHISLSGSGLSGDERYLYVRTQLEDASQYPTYQGSKILKYVFKLGKDKIRGEIELKADTETVDVGDLVTLEFKPTEEVEDTETLIFYTVDGTLPEFKVFMGNNDLSITDLNAAINEDGETIPILESREDYNYLKLNGFWYQYGKTVLKYDDTITVGSYIRAQNRLLIRARAIQSGKEMGDIISISMAHQLKQQVASPVSDVKTSDETPAQIELGSKINFSSATVESELFYTINGSVPVIKTETDSAGKTVTVPGNEVTMKYSSSTAVAITSDITSYGSNLTFMVKAVCYDGIYRKMKDSEVVKFTYKIADQPQVESVSAIPATDDLTPVTVSPGDKIMLYTKTQGATIYYTIDGSEPVRKKDGTPGKKTKKYNASKGVTVPEKNNETLFTITAIAYADGYLVSEVARLVYKYPDAVAPPYATPGSGVVSEFTNVELKSSTEGVVIYYEIATGDDEPKDPTQNSKVFDSASPISITGRTTIKAIAVSNGIASAVSTFTYRVSSKLSAPTPSLQSGSVIAGGTTLTLSADEGATIHYTTDGSNPADGANSNVNIGSTILLEGKAGTIVTIRTYASKEGFSNSEAVTYSYSFSNYGEAIFADKESGTVVRNGEIVKLNTDVSNGVIYYTTDGSMPSPQSIQGNIVAIQGQAGSGVTIKAIVIVPGTTQTAAAAVFTYTIMDKLQAPQSNVPSGAIFTEEGQVILSAAAGTIYYTTDGSQPTKGSSVYRDSITVNRDMTLRAIAVSEEADGSDVSTFVYSFAQQVEQPTASHENGELLIDTEIELDCATEGAIIYYTTNGTDPNLDDKDSLMTYTTPIKIDRAMTVKAVAAKNGMRESKVLTVGYTVHEEQEREEDSSNQGDANNNGRLMSRRAFSGEDQGPSYEDIILKNSTYGVMVSSPYNVIPDESKLNVNRTGASQSGQSMVKQQLGEAYDLVTTFDIGLEVEGEEVQPDGGDIEIGIPIEAEFQNTVIHVVYVGDDGTIELQETRRSGGMAYAKVTHLSQYAIVAPKLEDEEKKNLIPIIAVGTGIAVVIAAFVIITVVQRRKYYDR